FNNIDYLVSLENTENKNNLYIERIIKGDILDTKLIRFINFIFNEVVFTSFKVVNDLPILIKDYNIYFIPMYELFSLNKVKIFNLDVSQQFKLNKYSLTFDWPIIKYLKDNQFIILFNKCIFFLTLSYDRLCTIAQYED